MYYGTISEASSVFYLIDKRLPDDVAATFATHVIWRWMGDAVPLVLQKIDGIDLSAATTTAHYTRIATLLPEYRYTHETVPFLNEEDINEENADAPYESHCLSHLWPGGKIELRFAGPCIKLWVEFSSLTDAEARVTALGKVQHLAASLGSDYVLVDPKTRRNGIITGTNSSLLLPTLSTRIDGEVLRATKVERSTKLTRISFILINLMLALALGLFLNYASARQHLLQSIDTTQSFTFEVQAPAELSGREFFPQFAARGIIRETGEDVTLYLFRNEYVRLRPSDLIEVYATPSPEQPYMLAMYYRSSTPLRVAGVIIPFEVMFGLMCATALLGLWASYANTLKTPVRRFAFERMLVWRTLSTVLAIIGIVTVVWIGNRWKS